VRKIFVRDRMPFEGKEKRLEVFFSHDNEQKSLRTVSIAIWTNIINKTNASLIQSSSSALFDAFVLSESSMFVYDCNILLITCGQTTVLSALPAITALARDLGMSLDHMQYSHANFRYPMLQSSPYSNVQIETSYMKNFHRDVQFTEVTCTQNMSWNCWTLFQRAHKVRPIYTLYLEDIDQQVAQQYTQNTIERSGVYILENAKLLTILQELGTVLDAYAFHPCGLSANGENKSQDGHWTLHVTPEPCNSFVSLEFCMDHDTQTTTISNFFKYWKPQKAQVIASGMATPFLEVENYDCVSKTTILAPGNVNMFVFSFCTSMRE
jgi:S-adenosylmethionine decarboxylase